MVDEATKAASEFIRRYNAQLGPLAPEKFSAETQHALLVLAEYIREKNAQVAA